MKTKRVPENANTITKGIVGFLRCHGHAARRINTVGIYDVEGGFFRKLAKDEKGASDVIACIDGLFVGLEVKFKGDTQKKDQKQFQREVEAAGGTYAIIKTYDQFLDWYSSFNTSQIHFKLLNHGTTNDGLF